MSIKYLLLVIVFGLLAGRGEADNLEAYSTPEEIEDLRGIVESLEKGGWSIKNEILSYVPKSILGTMIAYATTMAGEEGETIYYDVPRKLGMVTAKTIELEGGPGATAIKLVINGQNPENGENRIWILDANLFLYIFEKFSPSSDMPEAFLLYVLSTAGGELKPVGQVILQFKSGGEKSSTNNKHTQETDVESNQNTCSDYVYFDFDGPGFEHSAQITLSTPSGVTSSGDGKSAQAYSGCIGGNYNFSYSNNVTIIGDRSDSEWRTYRGSFYVPNDAKSCNVNIEQGFSSSINVFCH